MKEFIYLFEFKRDAAAREALKQIDCNDYALSIAADLRRLIRIGVSFDSTTGKLAGWETG